MARALSSLESEFGDNPVRTERNLLDRLRTCLPSSVTNRETVIRQTPPATPPSTPSLGTRSTRDSAAVRGPVLVCGYENIAASDLLNSNSENCPVKHTQVQRNLSEPAAAQVSGQLSQLTSDTHTCTLSSTAHSSPVLQGGRSSSTPISSSGKQVSLTPDCQPDTLAFSPANQGRGPPPPSTARSIQDMDAQALIQQLGDDYDDFEYNLQQFPASELLEVWQVDMYLKTLDVQEELGKKIYKNFKKIKASENPGIDPDVLESWKGKTSALATDLKGYRSEIGRKVEDLRPTSLQRQATHPASSEQTNQPQPAASNVDGATLETALQSLSLGQDDSRRKKQATLEVKAKMATIMLDIGCMLHQILGGFYEQSQLSEQSCQSEQSQQKILFNS